MLEKLDASLISSYSTMVEYKVKLFLCRIFFLFTQCINKDYKTVFEVWGEGDRERYYICSDQIDQSIEHFAFINILLPFPS